MSIMISFSMKPRKRWLPGRRWNMQRMQTFSQELAKELGYYCNVVGEDVIYEFCPEGFLWLVWKENSIVGDCQTNIAGPGFHAAVIHFLELYASRSGLSLFVQDNTGYYEDRDFLKMRKDHFYDWFTALMTQILKRRDQMERLVVCWPTDYYLPEKKNGMVLTHIRQFPFTEIAAMMSSGLSMTFAKDFFVWNEQEKDAYYYRNCALVLMNQKCYFMPSSRSEQDEAINGNIIELLEKALAMKPDIPFPKTSYLELCGLAAKKPVDVSCVRELAQEIDIGCRKGLLFRTIGRMQFAVPGNFLHDDARGGNAERYYDGQMQGGHDYYICAVNTEYEACFQEHSFKKDNVQETLEFEHRKAKYKVAVYTPGEREGKTVCSVAAQVIYKNQMTVISIYYENPNDQTWAINLIRKVEPVI